MTGQGGSIPLGVSGVVSVPRDRVPAGAAGQFLLTDDDRVRWLASRLERQLDSPVIAPGTGVIARRILQRFPRDPRPEFAKKLLLTSRDGQMHSTVAVSGNEKPVAVCFVCWRGLPSALVAARYGGYLNGFMNWVGRLNESGIKPLAFLQIDAFIEETVDAAEPRRPLDDCVALDVEYTYLPGYFFGPQQADDTVPRAVVMNLDLLSDEQKRQLAPLLGR